MRRNRLVMEAKRTDRKYADRGDVRRVVKIPRVKLDMETQISEENVGGGDSLMEGLEEGAGRATASPQLDNKDTSDDQKPKKKGLQNLQTTRREMMKPFSIDWRREIAQRYTFKRYNEDAKEVKKENFNPKQENITLDEEEAADKKPEEKTPVIQTVMQKGDCVSFYKAVSFVKKKSVPLRLNLLGKLNPPSSPISSRVSGNTNSAKSSRSNKSNKSRRRNKLKAEENGKTPFTRQPSPDTKLSPTNILTAKTPPKSRIRSRRKRTSSPEATPSVIPLTEIAKWKPETVNAHTKPYYEAWVNTTLSAITRDTDPQTVLAKREIIKQFQKKLENTPPALTKEEMIDERYAGRIRIHRRNERNPAT